MKRLLKYVGLGVLLIFTAIGVYLWSISMEVAEKYTVNSPDAQYKLLIATQSSPYKDTLLHTITDYFTGTDIFISVVDVSELEKHAFKSFDAFLIIHTTQRWRPPFPVSDFIEKHPSKTDIFTITTSSEGEALPPGVDGITSASNLLNVEQDARKAIEWVEQFLHLEA